MVSARALIFVTFGTFASVAGAQQTTEIFKCQEASGRFTYTNDKRETAGKKCEVVASQINGAPPQKAAAGTPRAASGASQQNFPRESSSSRASAKERQREI